MSTVLVTGGSGFVGSHVIVKLLEAGHSVRTTVRSLKKENLVREMVANAGVMAADRLSFFVADLERDEGWAEAVAGCDFVQHVASPLSPEGTRGLEDYVRPARDGVLRVLRASRDAQVKRVVFTSTCGAIYYGHPFQSAPFDETTWTNLDGEMSDYVRSKAIAERAAWDFMAREGGALELTVVNPSGVFGPALGPDFSDSLQLVKRLLEGMPGVPQLYFSVVDVRDVADLHVLAMTSPEAKGERFIAASGEAMSMLDVATVLRSRLGAAASKVPTRQMPNFMVRVASLFDSSLRSLTPMLGKKRSATSAKAQRVLGWKARSPEDAVFATAESLIELGLVKG